MSLWVRELAATDGREIPDQAGDDGRGAGRKKPLKARPTEVDNDYATVIPLYPNPERRYRQIRKLLPWTYRC